MLEIIETTLCQAVEAEVQVMAGSMDFLIRSNIYSAFDWVLRIRVSSDVEIKVLLSVAQRGRAPGQRVCKVPEHYC